MGGLPTKTESGSGLRNGLVRSPDDLDGILSRTAYSNSVFRNIYLTGFSVFLQGGNVEET